MEKETLKEIEKKEKLIFNPEIGRAETDNVEVLRIEKEEGYTRIDFGYTAPRYYINGGWIQIDEDTFIRPSGTKVVYPLAKAVNIPIGPQKHYFQRCGQTLYYTLYFSAIPDDVAWIDIIEREPNTGTYFNFYGVSLTKVKKKILMIDN